MNLAVFEIFPNKPIKLPVLEKHPPITKTSCCCILLNSTALSSVVSFVVLISLCFQK